MVNPNTNRASNAGPFTIGLDRDVPVNDSVRINMDELTAGPRNQKGYLKKFYGKKAGMDFVYVQNGSGSKIHVELTTGHVTTVKSATSSNIEGPTSHVTIWHESDTAIPADDIDIQVGNGPRQIEDNSGPSIGDILPIFMG